MQILVKTLNLHFQLGPEVTLVTSDDIDVIHRPHLLKLAIDLSISTNCADISNWTWFVEDDFIFMRWNDQTKDVNDTEHSV